MVFVENRNRYFGKDRMKLIGLCMIGLWLFAACSPIRYIGIEVYNPSGISFPKEVRKVLIVNNAVPQPEVPYVSTLVKNADSITIAADSALFGFCRTLGVKIAESSYFEDVRLLEESYRADTYFFSDQQLSPDDVSVLCREHEVDAIVSLDRLMFQLKEAVQSFDFELVGWMDVEVAGVVRAYLPGKSTPLASIEIADTIYSQLWFDMLDLSSLSAGAEVLLQEATTIVAERALVNFVPYWSNDARWYYVSLSASWKEAAAYAASDKWAQANEKWKALYDETTDASWQSKARLASNLALSNELAGDFPKALYWATQSYQLLQGRLRDDDAYLQLQKSYVNVLTYRTLANKRLHLQIE